MTRIPVKEMVMLALHDEWKTFAAEHPRLAAVLDQELVAEAAMEALACDEEYRQAMDAAATQLALATVVSDVVRPWLRGWMRSFLQP